MKNVVQINKVDQCRCELVSDFSVKVKTVVLHGDFFFICQEIFILVSKKASTFQQIISISSK